MATFANSSAPLREADPRHEDSRSPGGCRSDTQPDRSRPAGLPKPSGEIAASNPALQLVADRAQQLLAPGHAVLALDPDRRRAVDHSEDPSAGIGLRDDHLDGVGADDPRARVRARETQ